MKTKNLLLFALSYFLVQISFVAQNNHCGITEDMLQKLDSMEQEFQMQIAQKNAGAKTIKAFETQDNGVITIPVVFHVLYNDPSENISDALIYSQIDALNDAFRNRNADTVNIPSPFKQLAADAKIEFCLAQRDPEGRPTNGIIRKFTGIQEFTNKPNSNELMKFSSKGGDDAWPSKQYLNVWVCDYGTNNSSAYAQFPGGSESTDGIVIWYAQVGVGSLSKSYNRGRLLVHEIGHWLNLRHIWGDANCGNDFVSDTPPQQKPNKGNPLFPHVSCNNAPNGDMFVNYMDYVNDNY